LLPERSTPIIVQCALVHKYTIVGGFETRLYDALMGKIDRITQACSRPAVELVSRISISSDNPSWLPQPIVAGTFDADYRAVCIGA
jgi:hypothetical protein